MPSETRSLATFASVAPGDSNWVTPENAASSNDIYAVCQVGIVQPNSEFLQGTNGGFGIGVGATIDGIEVGIEKRASAVNTIEDLAVRIVKGGVIGSTDRSSATAWPTSDTVVVHGSPTDLWGETWTVSDINSSGFGAAISGTRIAASAPQMFIDWMYVTVYFSGGTSGRIKRQFVRRLTEHVELDTY